MGNDGCDTAVRNSKLFEDLPGVLAVRVQSPEAGVNQVATGYSSMFVVVTAYSGGAAEQTAHSCMNPVASPATAGVSLYDHAMEICDW